MPSSYYDSTGKAVADGDTAVASDLNIINTAVDAAFQLVEADTSVIVGDSSQWAAKAEQWAEEVYGVEVEPGQYSALHHATDADTDAAAALVSKNAAAASAASASGSAAAALISQNAAAASETQTGLDAIATAADRVQTGLDAVATAADKIATNADVVTTTADAASTAADKIATNADVVTTTADRISTTASAAAAALSETNAGSSATAAQLRAWEAEAEKMTADSYATEAEDVFVNSWASDGDGTFTATPTAKYSALHWDAKAAAKAAAAAAAAAILEELNENPATTTGLTWGWLAGQVRSDNVITDVAAGTILLTDNTTNYVEYAPGSGVTVNQVGFTFGSIPVRTVITLAGVQTSSDDERAWLVENSSRVVQVVNVQDGEVATGTTTLPYDDTIPQNTEGVEVMSLAVTPTKATNILKIDVVVHGSLSITTSLFTGALFQDSTVDALAAAAGVRDSSINAPGQVVFSHYMIAGTTSPTTFKVRAGTHAANTFTFNGQAGTRYFGGVQSSSITITEIEV